MIDRSRRSLGNKTQSRSRFLRIGSLHLLGAIAAALLVAAPGFAGDVPPLHKRIDQLIMAKAGDRPVAEMVDDAGFLRRVYLDLAGRIPTIGQCREFLADANPEKRAALVDRLLASDDYPRRMQEFWHVTLMERRADDPKWAEYLRSSFAANKPWDVLCRELLYPDPSNEEALGSSFFYTKRLENYGQNPVDHPGLTRDVGRLFLGVDLQCAQCHDHLFVNEYKQQDFQGLFIVYSNLFLRKDKDLKYPAVGEKLLTKKAEFMSVFEKVTKETGPRLPGGPEFEIVTFEKDQEWLEPPDRKRNFQGIPKYSPLKELAEHLPTADNPAFARNAVNRFWFMLMGRGLVHPLDLHHVDNPPSHPEVLDLLAQEFVAHRFDIKWLLGELARTETYQRASVLPEGEKTPPPESFLVAIEKRLLAEQLLASTLEATGERARFDPAAEDKNAAKTFSAMRDKFVKAFANPPQEPEEEFAPSLQSALFLLNDESMLELMNPRDGNLADRLVKLSEPSALAEELYLSVLTRLPSEEEKADVAEFLAAQPDRKQAAVSQLVWALVASTEFCVNH
jgi:hypothetical protein